MEVTLKTFEGFALGIKEVDFDNLDAAVRAFSAIPFTKLPRLFAGSSAILELDPEGGLAPVFGNREVEKAYARAIANPGFAALEKIQRLQALPNQTGPTE